MCQTEAMKAVLKRLQDAQGKLNATLEECTEKITHAAADAQESLAAALSEAAGILVEIEKRSIALQEAKRQLEDEKTALAEKRQAFEAERQFVADANTRSSDVIWLNVGGQIMSTSRKSLCLFPDSMLGAFFSGRHALQTDSEGRILIDRDPYWFNYILEFLRNNGQLSKEQIPEDDDVRHRVRFEFDYFCLPCPFDVPPLVEQFGMGFSDRVYEGHVGSVLSVDVTDHEIVSGGADKTVRVWDVLTGNCLHVLHGHHGAVGRVAAYGDRTATNEQVNDEVFVWDIHEGKLLTKLPLGGRVLSVGVGKTVAVATGYLSCSFTSVTIKVWDLETSAVLWQTTGLNTATGRVAVYNDSLVCGGIGMELKVWDVKSGTCHMTLLGHHKKPTHATITDDSIVSWSASIDGQRECVLWNKANDSSPTPVSQRVIHAGNGACMVHNGTFVSVDNDVLVLTDIATGTEQRLSGHAEFICGISGYGDMIATASRDATIRVWKPRRRRSRMLSITKP